MASPLEPKNERRLIDWLIAGFGIILAVLLFFLVRQYRTLRRESLLSARESLLSNIIKDHANPSASDISLVHSWMTFDYLDRLFHLPPDYLKVQLSITDPTYPKMTITKFAKDIDQNPSSTLERVQGVLRQYFANPLPVNTSST